MDGVGQPGVNEFKPDLQYSLAGRDEPFWDAVYKKAFPTLSHARLCHDLDAQRQGIDRLLVLTNGKTLAVDEKKRRWSYDDVLLEYLSNSRTGAPGWMEKDLAIDWLAYAFMDTRRVYLFSWPMLQRTWLHFKPTWIDAARQELNGFRIVAASNPGYTTYSIAVPLDLLRRRVAGATIIDLGGDDE